MYVIMVYDINQKRLDKVLKLSRQYLYHIQYSVFEGFLSRAELEELRSSIIQIINDSEDSLIIYIFRTKKKIEKEIIGVEKEDAKAIK